MTNDKLLTLLAVSAAAAAVVSPVGASHYVRSRRGAASLSSSSDDGEEVEVISSSSDDEAEVTDIVGLDIDDDDADPSPDVMLRLLGASSAAARRALAADYEEDEDVDGPPPDLLLKEMDQADAAAVPSESEPPLDPPLYEEEEKSLIEMQFGPDIYEGMDKLELIMSGELSLVDLRVAPKSLARGEDEGDDEYAGVMASFCKLEWGEHKKDPSRVPTFRDLVGASPHCNDHKYSFDLSTLIATLRSHDSSPDSNVRSVEPTAFLFHEGKSGSTLLTNALAVAEPERTRVVNEHGALVEVLNACDRFSSRHNIEDCDENKQVRMLRDVMYLLGRTSDPNEDRLYVKVQAAATVNMDVVRRAYPLTKWSFAYRAGPEVLAKHTAKKRNSCAKNANSPSKALKKYMVEELGHSEEEEVRSILRNMSQEEVCALYLTTLVTTALDEHQHSGTGKMIDYDVDLKSSASSASSNSPSKLTTDILPYFGVEGLSDELSEGKMRVVAQMGKHAMQRHTDRSFDGLKEVVEVRDAVKEASGKYMKNIMERMAKGKAEPAVEEEKMDDGE